MKPPGRRNLAASVAARLLEKARRTGDDYQLILGAYFCERFLYRLSQSPVSARFVLKGAMLLRLWADRPYRATRDLDLLRRGEADLGPIRDDIETICRTEVVPDGAAFDPRSIRLEAIRREDEYAGTGSAFSRPAATFGRRSRSTSVWATRYGPRPSRGPTPVSSICLRLPCWPTRRKRWSPRSSKPW